MLSSRKSSINSQVTQYRKTTTETCSPKFINILKTIDIPPRAQSDSSDSEMSPYNCHEKCKIVPEVLPKMHLGPLPENPRYLSPTASSTHRTTSPFFKRRTVIPPLRRTDILQLTESRKNYIEQLRPSGASTARPST